ncbi:MAG: hypothetical protein HY978_03985 [Candidatus Liptonbacteria bacterium]|nr:hypothetical protein [Candidatus Liptonbacteria bacterium]
MSKLFLVIIVLLGLGAGAYLASIVPSGPPLSDSPGTGLAREPVPPLAPVPTSTLPAPTAAGTGAPITPAPVASGVATGGQLTSEEALKIAQASVCLKEGSLTGQQFHNDQTETWWFDLSPKQPRPGCSPACVVFDVTQAAEINWRCTGAK